jgi:uncharacterized protein YxjI
VRYLMRQKVFSFGDHFVIKDEADNDRFLVEGKVFSLGDKLDFQDLHGRSLVTIQQRLLAWGPTYEIARQGQVIAVVKKSLFTLFNCRFSVDVPGPDDLEARGDFLDHEYEFSHVQDGTPAAAVSKSWWGFSDTYGVDVADGEDEVLILAATVVLDLCCHPDGDS